MTTTPASPTAPATVTVTRIEVWTAPGALDPHGETTLAEVRTDLCEQVTTVRTARVYLIEAALTDRHTQLIASELLADPITQVWTLGAEARGEHSVSVEAHYLPGVMDPVAASTEDAIREMLPELAGGPISVRTGTRYDLSVAPGATLPPASALQAFAERALANTVVQSVELEPLHPTHFPHGTASPFKLKHVPLRELDEEGLMKLSREGHLFLSLEEMQTIQAYYRKADREPTDIELETLAQTWSEHCVHKTLKATIRYRGPEDAMWERLIARPGHHLAADGTLTIHNLLKSTVAAATFKLKDDPELGDWLVSVFDDNAGVVRFDETDGVAIKVETHNHPSAIEPYGGAATGIGGCIRDIMGTGLSAKPIANTNVFAVASPNIQDLPKGIIHPRRVLQQVVAGVRDYGNRMGIPTVNGAVFFHDDYLGNPLVYAGCVGLIPLDKCFGSPQSGDAIVILGGRTGRDGIHGATFSSAELTDTHADEFSHAVQIGNAITEKKTLDVILQARDYVDPQTGAAHPLFNAISDCGAGGFSSAVGEMGEKVGARVDLERAPLKYEGLTYTEIWISEAQERMPLAVPPKNLAALQALCDAEDVEMCVLGEFGHLENGEPTLQLNYRGQTVGTLAMSFMHDGLPMPTREAVWPAQQVSATPSPTTSSTAPDTAEALLKLLSDPNIASKHWIIRQYDHEVQGGSVIKPLVGLAQDGPSDGAVIRPKLDSNRAIALASGAAPFLSEKATETGTAIDGDSYFATLAAIDEAVRNVVCVGADPNRIAILDNFCWPKCEDPAMLGSLVRAAEACYDGAVAYRTPFVSGKDSLSNQFTRENGEVITIPQTLLVTALGIVPDALKARTMDAKAAGNVLLLVGHTTAAMGGSRYASLTGHSGSIPRLDLTAGPRNARAVARLIAEGRLASTHDCSEGGLLVAAAEMAFAGRIGLDLDLGNLPAADSLPLTAACFAETPSRYLLEVAPEHLDAAIRLLRDAGVPFGQVGSFAEHANLTVRTPEKGQLLSLPLDGLRQAWLSPLDW